METTFLFASIAAYLLAGLVVVKLGASGKQAIRLVSICSVLSVFLVVAS